MRDEARTLGALGLLTLALPLNAALTGAALARGAVRPPRRALAAHPRTVLVSGGKMTKALALARAFHRAGHRVVLVEAAKYRLTGHRLSRCVDVFRTVPPPEHPDYVAAMERIVREEGVDVYVPVCSPAASYHDALVREALEGTCEVVHPDPPTLRALDDKASFAELCASLGLRVPEAHRITDPEQLADFPWTPGRSYVLKSIPYDPVRRLDLTPLPRPTEGETLAFARALPIAPETPFVLQELVVGTEYCTHATSRDGALRVHLCCASSAWQLNYEQVEDPEIEAYVRRLVTGLGTTGQISLDLIRSDATGEVLAIECNPRTHSAITMVQDHPDLARAYLEDEGPEVRPLPGSRPTYWAYHEAWRALRRPWTLPERLRTVLRGREAIFDWEDPLPFLAVHHLQVPALLLANLRAGGSWLKIDFNIGKLVEPAGD